MIFAVLITLVTVSDGSAPSSVMFGWKLLTMKPRSSVLTLPTVGASTVPATSRLPSRPTSVTKGCELVCNVPCTCVKLPLNASIFAETTLPAISASAPILA